MPATELSTERLQQTLDAAHAEFSDLREGTNADYIPALAEVDPELFGLAIATADGRVVVAGDADRCFSIQSVSKPFTMAMVMEEQGLEVIAEKIGVEPSGGSFNSVVMIELNEQRTINPLVNAGGIAAVSLLRADGADARWRRVQQGFSAFAGEPLELLGPVYESESRTNHRNRAIANLLYGYGRLYCEPSEAVDVYTRQCALGVTARRLATMGATLANAGVNPFTGERLLSEAVVAETLAVMLMAGFYDESGVWSYRTGLPGKTGVGGGILAVAPGKLALVGFSPRLNDSGTSVRAQRALQRVSRELRLSVFLARG